MRVAKVSDRIDRSFLNVVIRIGCIYVGSYLAIILVSWEAAASGRLGCC
jgi:L-asparagine transporter-like permease